MPQSTPLTMIDDVSADRSEETAYSLTITWCVTLPPTENPVDSSDAVRERRAA